jgi:hypothetical protein
MTVRSQGSIRESVKGRALLEERKLGLGEPQIFRVQEEEGEPDLEDFSLLNLFDGSLGAPVEENLGLGALFEEEGLVPVSESVTDPPSTPSLLPTELFEIIFSDLSDDETTGVDPLDIDLAMNQLANEFPWPRSVVVRALKFFNQDIVDTLVELSSQYPDSTHRQWKALGYTASQLRQGGCHERTLREAGYSVKELIEAGFDV